MKAKAFLTLILCGIASVAVAQSFTVYDKEGKNHGYNTEEVDSIVFSPDQASAVSVTEPRQVKGRWCSLGTSISWLNDNTANYVGQGLTKGYQTRVMEKLAFEKFSNKAVNGGVLQSAINAVVLADYYTIEHGINDWGHSTPVGTIDDYINNTKNGTFAAIYRQLIDRIFTRNKKARVILCTPRKAYGFGGYLPDHWYDPLNNIYLEEYANIIRQIAAYESFPVADFFAECGGQRQLDNWSYDTALHPNDDGMQIMANVLIQAFEKILDDE
ncbi:MAG: SGNH/GDSL hydrolase family protein [Bacteroidaceae bacterium]|nr:SGNH/GDSL hydrolase family protein [Bacteroidaceae bacterium]